jgi:hypothetical protein
MRKLSGIAITALLGSRACAAIIELRSGALRTGAEIASIPNAAAAALKGFNQNSAYVADAGLYQHRDSRAARRSFFEQFNPFAGLRWLRHVEPCDVAAGSHEIRDEATARRSEVMVRVGMSREEAIEKLILSRGI